MSQILHGCKCAYCDTPTCLSSNRRNGSKPYRPPTQLTARALAHYLASQDNPRRGLCPHELKVPPSSVEIESAISIGTRQGADRECSVYPSIWKLAQQHNRSEAGKSDDAHEKKARSTENSPLDVEQSVVDTVNKRRQTKKDLKSLGQNLYDSATVIYSYSKQIPSPTSVLALLRAPDPVPHRTTTPHPNALSVTPHVNKTARIARQHSQQSLRAHSNVQTAQNISQVLSNGQQIHKIPYHPPSTANYSTTSKYIEPTTLDGTAEVPSLSIRKTGKKNFTIGGDKVSTMVQTRPPAATLQRPSKIPKPDHRECPVLPAVPNLNCDILDELKEDVYHHRKDQSADFNFVVDYDTNRRFRPTKPFVNRSLFYTLSEPDTLLQSFHDSSDAFKDSPLPHLNSTRLINSFSDWNRRNGALIFDSLWIAIEALFTPPPEIDAQKSPRLRPSRKSGSTESYSGQPSDQQKAAKSIPRYLSNHEAAHIVLICIHALTSSVSVGWTHTWAQLRKLRSWGIIVPNAPPNTDAFAHPYLNLIDELEYEPAIRLADRLLRGIGARTCFERILASLNRKERPDEDTSDDANDDVLVGIIIQHLKVVERVALISKRKMKSTHDSSEDPGWTVTATFIEWLRTIIIKNWDGKAAISKWSSVGTAVMLLDKLRKQYAPLI